LLNDEVVGQDWGATVGAQAEKKIQEERDNAKKNGSIKSAVISPYSIFKNSVAVLSMLFGPKGQRKLAGGDNHR